jgi:hypothetical protein
MEEFFPYLLKKKHTLQNTTQSCLFLDRTKGKLRLEIVNRFQ